MSERGWPALDGVRALAVLAVISYHFSVRFPFPWGEHTASGGFLGVDVFFVLSGFLITTLLVSEWDRLREISLRSFYARRAFRLLPALAVVVVAATVASFAIAGSFRSNTTTQGVPWVVLFVANWSLLFHQNSSTLGLLGVTWSLAVEEQYYLVWPFVLLVLLPRCRSRFHIGSGLLVAAAAEMVARALLMHSVFTSFSRVYYATYLHSDGLLVGSAVAFFLAARTGPVSPSVAKALRVAGPLAAAVLVVMGFTLNPLSAATYRYGISAAVACSAVLVLNLTLAPTRSLFRILSSRLAVWIGRRSYGLYLWHLGIYTVVGVVAAGAAHYTGVQPRRDQAVALALTFLVAAASYQFVERPFLRRKRKYRRVPDPAPTGPAIDRGPVSAG